MILNFENWNKLKPTIKKDSEKSIYSRSATRFKSTNIHKCSDEDGEKIKNRVFLINVNGRFTILGFGI